jgi:hypothetical protein
MNQKQNKKSGCYDKRYTASNNLIINNLNFKNYEEIRKTDFKRIGF